MLRAGLCPAECWQADAHSAWPVHPSGRQGLHVLLQMPSQATHHQATSANNLNAPLHACRGHDAALRPPSSLAHSRSGSRAPPAWGRDQSWAASDDNHQPSEPQAQPPSHPAHHHKYSGPVPEAAADRLGMPLPPQHLPWQGQPHTGSAGIPCKRNGSAQSVQARQQISQVQAQQPGRASEQPRAHPSGPYTAAATRSAGALEADLHPNKQAKAQSPRQGSWAAADGSCQSRTPRHIREHSFDRVGRWAAASAAHSASTSSQVPAPQPEPMQPMYSRSRGEPGTCLPAQQRDKWGQAVHSLDSLPGSGRIGVWSTGQAGSWNPHSENLGQPASPRDPMEGSLLQPAAPLDWLQIAEAARQRGSRRHKQASWIGLHLKTSPFLLPKLRISHDSCQENVRPCMLCIHLALLIW